VARKNRGGLLTRIQVDYILSGGTTPVKASTKASWMLDPRFVEIYEAVLAHHMPSTDTLVEKALKIVNMALDGVLPAEDNGKLSAAMKLINQFPMPEEKKVVFQLWEGMDMRRIPSAKRNRIIEEISNDKSLKNDVLPIDHVGHTKYGNQMSSGPDKQDVVTDMAELLVHKEEDDGDE